MSKEEREASEFLWKLMVELRKETLAAQRMRTQVIGFKITLVGSGVAILSAVTARAPDSPVAGGQIPRELLAIPGFASIFFDLLITSYSISIKRIGLYCRNEIEPRLKSRYAPAGEFLMWEEFFERLRVRHMLAILGNIGLTALALAPGFYVLWTSDTGLWWFILPLAFFALYDLLAFCAPGRITCPAGQERPGLAKRALVWLVEKIVFGEPLRARYACEPDALPGGPETAAAAGSLVPADARREGAAGSDAPAGEEKGGRVAPTKPPPAAT